MTKAIILVEITVDDNSIPNKYPNYDVNWEKPEDFIEDLIDFFCTHEDVNGVPFDSLKEQGFNVKVLSREEAKLIDLMDEGIL